MRKEIRDLSQAREERENENGGRTLLKRLVSNKRALITTAVIGLLSGCPIASEDLVSKKVNKVAVKGVANQQINDRPKAVNQGEIIGGHHKGLVKAESYDKATERQSAPEADSKPLEEVKNLTKKQPEKHWSISHPTKGIVHAWTPERRKGPHEVVVFIHAYTFGDKNNSSADFVWNRYKFGEQFRKSGLQALFIVPEASFSEHDKSHWEGDLDSLIAFVKTQTGVQAEAKKITIVSHSGGYTTAVSWLKTRNLDEIILLDGAYGGLAEFHNWLGQDGKKMVVVSTQTQRGSLKRNNEFIRSYIHGVPEFYGAPKRISNRIARSKIIYIKSPFAHSMLPKKRSGIIPKALNYWSVKKDAKSEPAKKSQNEAGKK